MASLRCSIKFLLKQNNFNGKLPLLSCFNGRLTQVAFIAHKNHIDAEIRANKPKPWPYETKKFTVVHEKLGLDNTLSRFDENTKVISIDGTVAVGKKEFGKKLADELGMRYFPQPDIDDLFVDYRGFDYCSLNPSLPEEAQFINMKLLHENPKHKGVGPLQWFWYQRRCYIYIDALAHLYSTGQGVIVDRNPWSDLVFVESLYDHGYMNKSLRNFLWRARSVTTHSLQRPHVVIYLDITPEESLKRIKARNGVDANSKLVNKEYLTTIEKHYKKIYLEQIEKHAEVLVYDWRSHGDIDIVIEDLEKLDFDQYELKGTKMKDWRFVEAEEFVNKRIFYTNKKDEYLGEFNLPTYDVEGLELEYKTAEIYENALLSYVPNQYSPRFDPNVHGWLKVLFGSRDNYRAMQNRQWSCIVKE